MKKLLDVMLAIIGLALIPPAYAQDFSVSLRSWDLVVISVEAEYHPIPHLGITAGVGMEVLSLLLRSSFSSQSTTNYGFVGGVSYFAQPDHTGLYGAGRVMYSINLDPNGATSRFGLFTTVGYRWMLGQNTQLDIEFGLVWLPYPGGVGTLPLISLGFGGYQF